MSVPSQRPVERIVRPFQDFARKQSSGGVLLIVAAAVALVWVNSPWGEGYAALWQTKLTVGVGDLSIAKDLTHWINDGLMAVFFLVVGLEIKREIFVGELSSVRGAALPVAAAVGGAVVPALIYAAIMPLFALANAGVPLGAGVADALTDPVALGIVAGLVLGKQIGVTLFAWLAVKSGLSELPRGIGWRHV